MKEAWRNKLRLLGPSPYGACRVPRECQESSNRRAGVGYGPVSDSDVATLSPTRSDHSSIHKTSMASRIQFCNLVQELFFLPSGTGRSAMLAQV